MWYLVDKRGCLDDVIVDSVLSYYFKSKSIGYVDTSVIELVEKSQCETPFSNYKDGYVAVKNFNKRHWVFVYVSYKDKTFYVVDPMHERVAPCSIDFVNKLKSNPPDKDSKWNLNEFEIEQIEHTKQTDGWNCGVFCIEFALKVLHSYPNTPEDLFIGSEFDEFRQYYAALLLGISKKIELDLDKNEVPVHEKENVKEK